MLISHWKAVWAAAALSAFAATSSASIVEASWDAAGRSLHSVLVEPKRFAEVCIDLPNQAVVAWRIDASAMGEFNVHHHTGNDVVYEVKRRDTMHDRGQMTAPRAQKYCWMWTNTSDAAARISLDLRRL